MKPERIKTLAQRLDTLAEQDELLLRRTRAVEQLRRSAAMQLHSICQQFVNALNAALTRIRLELNPEEYPEALFSDTSPNIVQINARGRIIQIEFRATETLTSTEHFRRSYILEGAVRCYNQELLERLEIQEHLLFYCLDERRGHNWQYFDPRTYRTGAFDQEYLASMIETLV